MQVLLFGGLCLVTDSLAVRSRDGRGLVLTGLGGLARARTLCRTRRQGLCWAGARAVLPGGYVGAVDTRRADQGHRHRESSL